MVEATVSTRVLVAQTEVYTASPVRAHPYTPAKHPHHSHKGSLNISDQLHQLYSNTANLAQWEVVPMTTLFSFWRTCMPEGNILSPRGSTYGTKGWGGYLTSKKLSKSNFGWTGELTRWLATCFAYQAVFKFQCWHLLCCTHCLPQKLHQYTQFY